MHHFLYKNGILHAEDVSIPHMAEEIGTPFYCYSSTTLERHARIFAQAFESIPSQICYAVKANSNQAVLSTLARLGIGMDVVSEGELRRALAASVPAKKIIFSGVGKTERELSFALDIGILCFNVESEEELFALSRIAQAKGCRAPISLRVNPDVDAQTHAKISTGRAEDKFGIAWQEARTIYQKAAALPGIQITGIDMHIGSQITQLGPFEAAFSRLQTLVEQLRADGHHITHVDLGGGLGIPYREDQAPPPLPQDYAAVILRHIAPLGCTLILEPGRLIAGNAGILITRLIYRKEGQNKNFFIVDAAMNDLIRPTLYEAYHEIKPVCLAESGEILPNVDVVGPVCETGDFLARGRQLPSLPQGALLAIFSAGAYGAVKASTYNTRLLIPEVMVHKNHFALIRPRGTYAELINHDQIPSWLLPTENASVL